MAGLIDDVRNVVGIGTNNPASSDNLTNTVTFFANFLISIIAAVSVFFIIKGAWEWINGNEKNEAQQTIINAVIGLIVAILAFFIVQFFVGSALFLNNSLD